MRIASIVFAIFLAASLAAQTAPPPVTFTFDSATAARVYPADAGGAVGRTHIVTASNAGLVVHDRTGRNVGQLTLAQFWESAQAFVYHPHIAYDAAADRWIMASMRNANAVLLAVSKSGNPLGEWTRHTIDITTGGELDLLKMAVTRDSVLLVAERLSYSSCVMMRAQKADLYAGVFDKIELKDARGSASQVIPVSAPESDEDYLLSAGDFRNFDVKRFEQFQWQDVVSPRDWVRGLFNARQRDTGNQLDFGFDGVKNAVLRDGMIWAVQMLATAQTRQRTVLMWTKIDPVSLTVRGQGIIDDGRTYYGFPSVAATRHGVLIAYAVTSTVEYPSARYVFIDPAGNVSAEAPLRNGTTSIRNFQLWGNYTTTLVDPTAGSTFWTLQMFAENNTWATAWASIKVPAIASKRRAARH